MVLRLLEGDAAVDPVAGAQHGRGEQRRDEGADQDSQLDVVVAFAALAEGQLSDLLVASEQGRNAAALPLDQKVEGRWDERFRWEALATPTRAAEPPMLNDPILVHVVFDVFWKSGPGGDAEKKLTLETSELWQQPARGTR